ncbi:MAG: helix-turn-helix transcriptional regulator [Bacteroidales bacterium]|nr:helix-turn-helix transcriptional regulator [Bacteroidales bacterium]
MKNILNDNILTFIEESVGEIQLVLAHRIKQRRLEKNLTQGELSARSGLSLASYRRFEKTGEISLKSLILVAKTLTISDDFMNLFNQVSYRSIEDVLEVKKTRKRSRTRASKTCAERSRSKQ